MGVLPWPEKQYEVGPSLRKGVMKIFEVRLLAIRGDTSRQLELFDMIKAWLVHNKTQECANCK